jgi:hypothetical protein
LNTVRQAKEPPGRLNPDALKFVIAEDASRNWIVMEAHGLCGGVFASREAAIHFADLECRNREATFEVVTGRIERLQRKNGKLHCQR